MPIRRSPVRIRTAVNPGYAVTKARPSCHAAPATAGWRARGDAPARPLDGGETRRGRPEEVSISAISASAQAPGAGAPGASLVAIGIGTGDAPAKQPGASSVPKASPSPSGRGAAAEGTRPTTITVAGVYRRAATSRVKEPPSPSGTPAGSTKEEVSDVAAGTRPSPVSGPSTRKGAGDP